MTNNVVPALPKPTRFEIFLWLAIMLLMPALCLYDWDGYQVGTYGDDASYVTNADSLLQRVPYGTLLTPGEDRVTQFPFLLPLLLTPFRAFFPNSMDAMRVVPLVTSLLAMVVLFWGWGWIGRGLSYRWGIAVIALTALSPVSILHARTIMSEGPFLLLTLLMIIWVEKIVSKPPRAWGILFGILLVLLMYTRSIGWLFGIVWIAYLFWKCGRAILPQLALALSSGILLLGLVLATTTVRPIDLLPQEYLAQLANSVDGIRQVRTTSTRVVPVNRTQRNAIDTLLFALFVHLDFADKLPYEMESAVIAWTDSTNLTFLRILPGVLAIGVLCVGAWALWRKQGLTAFQIIAPPYLALLFIWAWNGSRLFYPVQAQLITALLVGLYTIAGWFAARLPSQTLKSRFAPSVVAASVALLLAGCIWLDLKFTRAMLLPGDQIERAAQLTSNIPPGAIVLSSRATTDHLYADRTFVDIPSRVYSTQDLIAYLKRQKIDYVAGPDGLKTSDENERLRISPVERYVIVAQPLIDANVYQLTFEDAANDFAIYRVNPNLLSTFKP